MSYPHPLSSSSWCKLPQMATIVSLYGCVNSLSCRVSYGDGGLSLGDTGSRYRLHNERTKGVVKLSGEVTFRIRYAAYCPICMYGEKG